MAVRRAILILLLLPIWMASDCNGEDPGPGPGPNPNPGKGQACVFKAHGESIRYNGDLKAIKEAQGLPTEDTEDNQANIVTIDKMFASYEIALNVGEGKLFASLDTGSTDLVVMGNGDLCPGCKAKRVLKTYTPSENARIVKRDVDLSYGEGLHAGVADMYEDTHGLTCSDPDNPTKGRFPVWKSGKNISSIFGLAYPTLGTSEGFFRGKTPFFEHLVQDQGFEDKFSMALCGEGQGSAIVLGANLEDRSGKGFVHRLTKCSNCMLSEGWAVWIFFNPV